MTKDYLVYLLGKLFPATLSFLVMVFVIKTLPASEYGAYSLFLATSGFFSSLFFAWLRLSITRRYEHIKGFFSANDLMFLLVWPVLLLLCSVVVIGILWFCDTFGWREVYGVLAASLLLSSMVGLFDVMNEFNRVTDHALRYNGAMIVKAVATSAVVFLLYLLHEKQWFFFAMASVLGGGVGLFASVRAQREQRHFRFSARKAKKRLRGLFLAYGMPFSLSILVSFFIFNSDRYILTAYYGAGVLGEYAAVSNLVMLCVNTVLSTLCLVWNPKLFRISKNEGRAVALEAHYAKGRLFAGLSLVLVLLSGGVGSFFYVLIGVENDYTNYWSITLVSFGYACLYFKVYYLDTLMQLFNSTDRMLVNAVFVAVCSVVMNIVFVPRFGPMAIPVSYVVSAFLGAALVFITVFKCQRK